MGRKVLRPDNGISVYRDVSKLVICGQGPPPPNPQVVERFQQVISQLFQQVQSPPTLIIAKDPHYAAKASKCCQASIPESRCQVLIAKVQL